MLTGGQKQGASAKEQEKETFQFLIINSYFLILYSHQLEVSHEAKHKGMTDIMIFDKTSIRLPDVEEIAHAQGDTLETHIHRQKLTET